MAQKFLTDIEVTQGLVDSSGDLGVAGQVLSSTGTGTNWITNESNSTVVYLDEFTGDNSTVDFTLSVSVTDENITQVYLDGVYQHKDTYSISNTTLTFSTAPPLNADIEVITFSTATTADDLQAGVVVIPVKNTHTASIAKGEPVYITGNVGNSARLQIAPADASNSAKMPSAGLLLQTLAVNELGYIVTGGYLRNLTTDVIDGTSTSSNMTVYVKAGGGLTVTKPTGAGNLIQNVAKVASALGGNAGSLLVSSILRTNDVPNLTTGKIWVGDGNTTESTVVHLDETNGRMGIGTSSPSHRLHVVSAGNGEIKAERTSGAAILTQAQSALGRFGTTTNHNLQFMANSNGWMTITTAGNVGISVTSPGHALDISGNIRLQGGNRKLIYNNGSVETSLDQVSGATAGLFTLGNIGIGTTSILSGNKLDVRGGNIMVGGFGGGTDYGLILTPDDGSGYWNIANVTGGALTFNNSPTIGSSEQMRLTTTGLGIGTTSPVSKLHVVGEARVYTGSSLGYWGVDAGNSYVYLGTNSSGYGLSFQTSGTEKMHIASNGFVGIGVTSPNAKLSLAGGSNINSQNSILYIDTNSYYASGADRYITSSTAARYFQLNGEHIWSNAVSGTAGNAISFTERMRIGSAGAVTITADAGNEQFVIKRASNTNENLILGFHSSDYATIQAVEQNVAYRALVLNPSGGNIGIATTSPAAKLQVRIGGIGSSTNNEVDGVIFEGDRHDLIFKQIRTAASSDWNSTTFRLQNRVDTTLMSSIDFVTDASYNRHIDINTASNAFNTRFTHNGRVGIGTTSPSKTLSVNGEIFQKTRLNLQRGSGGATTLIQFLNEVGTDRAHIDFGGTNEELSFFAGAGSSEHMRITAAGTVGIGTTSPFSDLSINVGVNAPSSSGNMASEGLTVHNASGGRAVQIGVNESGAYNYIQSSYVNNSNVAVNLAFFTGASERMRIDTSGNIMMGKNSQSGNAALTVKSMAGGNTGLILIEGDTTNDGHGLYATTDNKFVITRFTNGSYSDNFVMDSSGNVKFNSWIRGTSDTNMLYSSTGLGLLLQAPSNSGTGSNIYFRNANGTVFQTFSQANGAVTFTGTLDVASTIYTAESLRFDGTGLNATDKKLYSPSDGCLEWFTHQFAGTPAFAVSHQGTKKVYLNVSGNSYLNGGNVGIGTTTPSYKLHVVNSGASAMWIAENDSASSPSTNAPALTIQNTNTNDNVWTGINFADAGGQVASAIYSAFTNQANNYGIQSFYTRGSDGYNERLRITETGLVGIGTTSPGSKLEVKTSGTNSVLELDNSDTNYTLIQYNASGATKGFSGFNAGFMLFGGESGTTTRLQSGGLYAATILTNGNFGIGTTSPAQKLHVDGNIQVGSGNDRNWIKYIRNGGAAVGGVGWHTDDVFYVAGHPSSGPGAGNMVRVWGFAGDLRLGDNTNGDVITIDAGTANVGIRETNPASTLVVRKDTAAGRGGELSIVNYAAGGTPGIGNEAALNFGLENSTYNADFGNAQIKAVITAANNKSDMVFSTWNGGSFGERLRIQGEGNVGIGLTNPDAKLEVTGGGSAYTFRGVYSGTNGSYAAGAFQLTGGSTGPSLIDFIYSTTFVGQIVTTGTAVLYQSNSDYRLKENIVEMTGALDRVSQLKPSRFNFIADANTTVDGFLAHELQEIVPQAVSGEKDAIRKDGTPKYQGVDHSQIVPLLVGAIQELKAEIETLKNQINGIN